MAKKQYTVTLSQQEYEVWRERAKAAGTSVNSLTRLVLLRDEVGLHALVEQGLRDQQAWLTDELDRRLQEQQKWLASEFSRQKSALMQVASAIVLAMGSEQDRERVSLALAGGKKEE